jgi:hypothetical protein
MEKKETEKKKPNFSLTSNIKSSLHHEVQGRLMSLKDVSKQEKKKSSFTPNFDVTRNKLKDDLDLATNKSEKKENFKPNISKDRIRLYYI